MDICICFSSDLNEKIATKFIGQKKLRLIATKRKIYSIDEEDSDKIIPVKGNS